MFFIFWPSKICVSPTAIISSLFSPRCRLSSDQRCHTAIPCCTFFPWSQDELDASTSSFGNTLSHRLSPRVETEALNPHHHCRSPSPDHPTPTIHCYKKIISILITLPTTQSRLYFTSSLAKASYHRSFTCHRHFLLLSSHDYRSSAQRHPRWWTSRSSFTFRTTYRPVNSYKYEIFWNPAASRGIIN
jgi:hypothetical protein